MTTGYDAWLIDLDGVVLNLTDAIPGAGAAIAAARDRGIRCVFATNNASRSPAEVAELLTGLGVPTNEADVVTSAVVTVEVLADALPAGARVLAIGAPSLAARLAAAGFAPVSSADDDPAAIVQGFDMSVGWPQLAEGAVALHRGARWYATNDDRTLPSPRGPLPGNGALLAALMTASDRAPDVVIGKPHPLLFQTAARRVGAQKPLVIGDRLETDIDGALAAGFDNVLVLTGVSTEDECSARPADRRPTYVVPSLSALSTELLAQQ